MKMKEKIRLKDISPWVRVGIIGGWMVIVQLILGFLLVFQDLI
jgi:hypothetical protein